MTRARRERSAGRQGLGAALLAAIHLGGTGILPGTAEARAQDREPVEDFGRWEKTLISCRLMLSVDTLEGTAPPCRSLRLDQPMGGLLRVNFVSAGGESRFSGRELIFVGLLEPKSRPMRCHEGLCEPNWPIHLEVRALAWAGRDGDGVATALPRSHLAQGHCLLEAGRIECRAVSRNGGTWQADARF